MEYMYADLHLMTDLNTAHNRKDKSRLYHIYSRTRVKTHNLFRVDENSLEQCCAAHIVQCCQQYCSALLNLTAG